MIKATHDDGPVDATAVAPDDITFTADARQEAVQISWPGGGLELTCQNNVRCRVAGVDYACNVYFTVNDSFGGICMREIMGASTRTYGFLHHSGGKAHEFHRAVDEAGLPSVTAWL